MSDSTETDQQSDEQTGTGPYPGYDAKSMFDVIFGAGSEAHDEPRYSSVGEAPKSYEIGIPVITELATALQLTRVCAMLEVLDALKSGKTPNQIESELLGESLGHILRSKVRHASAAHQHTHHQH